jgi:hypothetical protein
MVISLGLTLVRPEEDLGAPGQGPRLHRGAQDEAQGNGAVADHQAAEALQKQATMTTMMGMMMTSMMLTTYLVKEAVLMMMMIMMMILMMVIC